MTTINYGYSEGDEGGSWWVDQPNGDRSWFDDGRKAYALARKLGTPLCVSRKRHGKSVSVPFAAPDEEEIKLAEALQESLRREGAAVQGSMDAVRVKLQKAVIVHYAEERGTRTFEAGISKIPASWGNLLGGIALKVEACLPPDHFLGSIRFGSEHSQLGKRCTVSFTVHCPWGKQV